MNRERQEKKEIFDHISFTPFRILSCPPTGKESYSAVFALKSSAHL
jgi:hypothetical protein